MINKKTVAWWEASEREIAAVTEVLKSGQLSYGAYSQRLETNWAILHGAAFGVLANSGTSALLVALQALAEYADWPEGSEIIVPAVTFVATINVVLQSGFTPVLVDVDPDTYNIDVKKIEEAITVNTVAILPVHLFGQPADMEAIAALANRHQLYILADSCETVGATFDGEAIGKYADVTCFSTYLAHTISAGIGGLAITNNIRLADIMRSMVNHGRDTSYISNQQHHPDSVHKRFSFVRMGHSFRITEMEAALAVTQLDNLPEILASRRHNAAILMRELAISEEKGLLVLPTIHDKASHTWMMFPIVLTGAAGDRRKLVDHLEKSGIETRPMLPILSQPTYAGRWDSAKFPVAANIDKYGFYVGCHPYLTDEQMLTIAEEINGFLSTSK